MSDPRWTSATDGYTLLRYARKFATARQLQLVSFQVVQLLGEALNAEQHRRSTRLVQLTWEQDATPDAQAEFQQHYQAVLHETQAWVQQHPRGTHAEAERCEEAVMMAQAAMIAAPVDGGLQRVMEWVDAHVGHIAGRGFARSSRKRVQLQIATIFRDIIAWPEPDRAVTTTELTQALARGIVRQRAWDRLPLLADALEEAGTTDGELLAHLRSHGPHHPGCWAVECALR